MYTKDAWRETDPKRLAMEMAKVAHRLEDGIRCEDIISDWRPLLSPFETNNLAKYESLWEKKHNVPAAADAAAAFVLMQDAATHTTMVNKEACQQIPTCVNGCGSNLDTFSVLYKVVLNIGTHVQPVKPLWFLCM